MSMGNGELFVIEIASVREVHTKMMSKKDIVDETIADFFACASFTSSLKRSRYLLKPRKIRSLRI